MKTRISQISPDDRTAVFYADGLVLTVEHNARGGYEILVEVDTEEYPCVVPVEIGNALGESVEWDL